MQVELRATSCLKIYSFTIKDLSCGCLLFAVKAVVDEPLQLSLLSKEVKLYNTTTHGNIHICM